MAVYYREPDTPEVIQFKIDSLQQEVKVLEKTFSNNRNDLMKNHLSYSEHIIEAKKTMLNETDRSIRSKKNKINSYTVKLNTLKNGKK